MPRRPAGLPRLDPRSLPGPEDIRRWVLPNGIVLLARENHASPSVVLTGYLGAGGLLETRSNAGLADLTAGALMRGTQRQSFQKIYESVESIGASLSFSGGKHKTSFHGKALAEDLGLLLSLLAEVLRQPAFPREEVERLRAERLTALNIRDQDTGAMAALAFDELAYRTILRDSVRRHEGSMATRRQVVEFHRSLWTTGMVRPWWEVPPRLMPVDTFGDWAHPAGAAACR
jgi:zinc protease